MQSSFPLLLLPFALLAVTNVLSITTSPASFYNGTLTCYNYSMRGNTNNYNQTEDTCPDGIHYCFSVVHKFRSRSRENEKFRQSSVSGCADKRATDLCDDIRKEGKDCLLEDEAHRRFWNDNRTNPKIELRVVAVCCLTENRGNNWTKVIDVIARNAKSSCYRYTLDPSSTAVDDHTEDLDFCFANSCKSVMHTVTRDGELHHYMVGGCTNEYEDIVCSKMGTDGCLYGEDALATFAHRFANTTIEIHAFCCCYGRRCNSWQKLTDNSRLSVCYKYNNVYIGDHDSDTKMKSNTCPSKTCVSLLVHRSDGSATRQMVTGDCSTKKACEDIGTDVCLYDEDAAQTSLSQKYLASFKNESDVNYKVKSICCCSGERCNTVDGLFVPSESTFKLTTNQCYEYRSTYFINGTEKMLKVTKRPCKYCLSRYGSVTDATGSKTWLDAKCTNKDVCNEIIGKRTTDAEGCLAGDAASNSSHGSAFLVQENKGQAYNKTLAMVCCCKTDKCNSASALRKKYAKETATKCPRTTKTSIGTTVTNSPLFILATLFIGSLMILT